jgi:hypothetical protein
MQLDRLHLMPRYSWNLAYNVNFQVCDLSRSYRDNPQHPRATHTRDCRGREYVWQLTMLTMRCNTARRIVTP